MVILMTMLAFAVPGPQEAVYVAHRGPECKKACRKRRYKRRIVRPYNSKLNRMASCESGRRWHINTGNGYYGGLQFKLSTWRSVGGKGYPHNVSKLEQKFRAVTLIKRAGYAPWPRCGYV